jgi:hypothetical protein
MLEDFLFGVHVYGFCVACLESNDIVPKSYLGNAVSGIIFCWIKVCSLCDHGRLLDKIISTFRGIKSRDVNILFVLMWFVGISHAVVLGAAAELYSFCLVLFAINRKQYSKSDHVGARRAISLLALAVRHVAGTRGIFLQGMFQRYQTQWVIGIIQERSSF